MDVFANLFAEQRRSWRRLLNAPRVGVAALSTKVGTSPHDVVFRRGTLRLLRYRRETPATQAEPVVFCYALVNRSYILDLQPEKSVVARYLERGFEVYLIDWGVPTADDRHLTIDDYVHDLLGEVVSFVLRTHRLSSLHLLGYCMGGTIATMFAALEP